MNALLDERMRKIAAKRALNERAVDMARELIRLADAGADAEKALIREVRILLAGLQP